MYINKSYCPYRICPLGAHVDHQLGYVTGFAIDKGITIEYNVTNDGRVLLTSNNFFGIVSFDVNGPYEKKEDWGNYLRGIAKKLSENYKLTKGIEGNINGQLPIGGLSSSSAVSIAFLKALAEVNNISLDDGQLIEYAYWAETSFIGLKIGKLDQSCEVLCKKDNLLFLDTKTLDYKLIPFVKNDINYEFLIIYSGKDRRLESCSYNLRVDECKSTAYYTKAILGKDYGKYNDMVLRNITHEEFLEAYDKLPKKWRMRAEHYFNENDRVLKGVEAWRNGDIETFGKLVSESGRSSIELYEAGSPLLIGLYNILINVKGVYGTRFMGGGFNGCCLAIIDSSNKDAIMKEIEDKYTSEFSEIKKEFSMCLCKTDNGVGK